MRRRGREAELVSLPDAVSTFTRIARPGNASCWEPGPEIGAHGAVKEICELLNLGLEVVACGICTSGRLTAYSGPAEGN